MIKKIVCLLAALVFMISFSLPSVSSAHSSSHKKEFIFSKHLKAISKKTYKYFEDFTDEETGLTYDEVRKENGSWNGKKYTSPTNIGMYLMSTVSAETLGQISKKEAVSRIDTTLSTLEDMKKWNGLFYNWYYTDDASLKTDWGQFISTVDNGWLSAGLIVAGEAYPSLSNKTDQLVEAMDYSKLYDPEVGQMYGGYDVEKGSVTEHHYGAFYTEPRVASYIAIGKGDVPKEHWWKMYRTMPESWDWQSQQPEGVTKTYDGVEVFEGHYSYKGKKFVPSWGGSMFEALMPGLVLKEKELGKDGLGLNNDRYVDLQIEYAKEQGYPAWGLSPTATPDGYSALGAAPLGMDGYESNGIVTPHATFLAMEYAPFQAFKNLFVLRALGTYGEYGYHDSVNVKTGEVTQAYLALDQGMSMVALTNYLTDGKIRDYFHHSSIGKTPEDLLRKEEFSIK
ncbi:DUF3131 domain-containing protein [Halobacillus salinarum]|uniref:DUF3131 domain-containing protein n=1 Tax=Halobacillus salinarum TaxID=2932257 RepID=A0ABY4EEF3_9BACI|nr:glucoamylase family protein [Halobacillus salinarum]UOQ42849.1 DUF3131 domain-containing protein [Halobacillus salinarum]